MKKMLLALTGLLLIACNTYAQSSITTDLELIFRDAIHDFVIQPGDSLDVGFAVVNHGPGDVDTSGFVKFGMTGIPPGFFLVVQSESGALMPINNGDTVSSLGVRFLNNEQEVDDIVDDYCFFLRVNEDVDSFIYDPNQLNDTICFTVTYKGIGTTSIAGGRKNAGKVWVSPNPAIDRVSIGISTAERQAARITVYSIDGRRVHTEDAVIDKSNPVSLNIQGWTKGVYFVEVSTGKERYNTRLVVQ